MVILLFCNSPSCVFQSFEIALGTLKNGFSVIVLGFFKQNMLIFSGKIFLVIHVKFMNGFGKI